MSLVYCEYHNPPGTTPVAHVWTTECEYPHYATPACALPSMTAAETLDPREEVAS